ncbi:dihydroxyacetone kinase subunit DhaL [Crenothrix polyspora]|uniref:Dihydroxyacetone kinase, L subunit n=1 Tax=Crenothrix polyspora TaxID=360316 RepID=A0A1R4H6S6_9GAMM|nr:dihydroxyacetone kinase subunit DhaL [Crenothrix polyspora]SJM91886.1 Dihydroxyacetone kinase, L subunit [Crenothrix polyspora]
MSFNPLLPKIIEAVAESIAKNADDITLLDQAIGDGDHVTNLQRGLAALLAQKADISQLEWPAAWQKMGMTIMTTVGGASGSLFGTLFIAMSKALVGRESNVQIFSLAFTQAVEAVKQRGKSDVGEKTMLDVLVPVAQYLQEAVAVSTPLVQLLEQTQQVALTGMESTREMLAIKGRASFLGERTKGHIDAGAMSSCVIICAVADVLLEQL